jgi:hypothetical protein
MNFLYKAFDGFKGSRLRVWGPGFGDKEFWDVEFEFYV